MNGQKKILIRGTANSVGKEQKAKREWMGVPEMNRKVELQ
jgi:hypothetical protein